MDPISILFSSFLTGITNNIHTQVQDIMGTEVQYRVVEYQDQKIDFQYQIWKIKDASVCAIVNTSDLSNHSSCTVAAKGLFTDTCSYLQSHPQKYLYSLALTSLFLWNKRLYHQPLYR